MTLYAVFLQIFISVLSTHKLFLTMRLFIKIRLSLLSVFQKRGIANLGIFNYNLYSILHTINFTVDIDYMKSII